MTLLVALGDSTSCGEGVGLRLDPRLTWPARLARAVPDGRGVLLARPGARIRDVVARQLPQLAEQAPDVVTLLIGLNDLARSDFDGEAFAVDLDRVVDAVLPTGARLLLLRLPEPAAHLPLPRGLRSAVRRRAAEVNVAVDEARAGSGGRVVTADLTAVPGLRLRRAWDVDRLHPNSAGHALIAHAAAAALRRTGLVVDEVDAPPLPAAPGPLREGVWLLRDGLPWLATHVPQVVVPAVRLAFQR